MWVATFLLLGRDVVDQCRVAADYLLGGLLLLCGLLLSCCWGGMLWTNVEWRRIICWEEFLEEGLPPAAGVRPSFLVLLRGFPSLLLQLNFLFSLVSPPFFFLTTTSSLPSTPANSRLSKSSIESAEAFEFLFFKATRLLYFPFSMFISFSRRIFSEHTA